MPHNDDAQTLIQLLNCPTLQLQTETDHPPRRLQSEAAARCVLEGPLERKHKKGCMKLMHRAQPIPSRLLRKATLPDYTDRLSCLLPRTRAVVGFFLLQLSARRNSCQATISWRTIYTCRAAKALSSRPVSVLYTNTGPAQFSQTPIVTGTIGSVVNH